MELDAKYEYDGLTHIEYKFKGKKAITIFPPKEKMNGQTILKTEYFSAFPELQNEFVKRGYTLIYIENRNRWGTPCEVEDQFEFVNYVAEEFGISNKVIAIGMSCGGMMAILLAAKYPQCIKGLYLDAPVVNYLSCPGRMGVAYDVFDSMWQEFESAWGITKSQLLTFREHPLDKLDKLVENRVRVYMAYGDSDKTVPYEENGIALERAYLNAGIVDLLKIDKKVGVDHHPHGPGCIDDVIEFFEK